MITRFVLLWVAVPGILAAATYRVFRNRRYGAPPPGTDPAPPAARHPIVGCLALALPLLILIITALLTGHAP